jgi:hypothetical protein
MREQLSDSNGGLDADHSGIANRHPDRQTCPIAGSVSRSECGKASLMVSILTDVTRNQAIYGEIQPPLMGREDAVDDTFRFEEVGGPWQARGRSAIEMPRGKAE